MMDKEMTYDSAMRRLGEIVALVEGNEPDIDRLSGLLKEAQVLIAFCKDKIYKADEDIKKIIAP